MISLAERQSLHDEFVLFADRDFKGYTPLYETVARGVAEDDRLLALCSQRIEGQPPVNLIFGAVQYLLLSGTQHDLRQYYASCVEEPRAPDSDSFQLFRDFCLEHEAAVRGLIGSRLVQTNEVGRSACLLPAYSLIAQRQDDAPLAMIDFGCSAGLNLLFDRFHYDYGALRWGDAASPVKLQPELRGDGEPPITTGIPQVAYRIGVDINPIDVTDDDQLLWLRALVWPEHTQRQKALVGAASLFRAEPQRLLRGDGIALLTKVADAIPAELPIVVYTSFVLYQLSEEETERFFATLAKIAASRPLFLVSMGGNTLQAQVDLFTWKDGERQRETVLECHAHGHWLRWLGPAV